MSTNPKIRRAPRALRPGGFILVGVAMFILVITILALSLFSLSGFESQFMINAMRRDQAFSLAAGGIERARFALMATDTLEAVKRNLPRNGVIYAVAMQGPDPADPFADDSTGRINPNRDVWIRVLAQSGDAQVRLHAKFHPVPKDEYYKRLITAQIVDVNRTDPVKATHYQQTYLSGAVGEPASSADTCWNCPLPPAPPRSDLPGRPGIVRLDNLPAPDVVSWIASRMAGATKADDPGGSGNYTLDAGLGGVRYFWSPQPSPPQPDWNVHVTHSSPSIDVTGTAIWLLNPGILFDDHITINGHGVNPRLIIVAHSSPPGDGIVFGGGASTNPGPPLIPTLVNLGVSLILVTDRGIVFDSGPASDKDSSVGHMSMYAERVYITGPLPGHSMHLWHQPSMLAPYAPVDPIIDALYDLDVLPRSTAGAADGLTMVPGSWEDLSPGISP